MTGRKPSIRSRTCLSVTCPPQIPRRLAWVWSRSPRGVPEPHSYGHVATLLYCYLPTLLHWKRTVTVWNCRRPQLALLSVCPSVSTTRQTQTSGHLKMDNLKHLKANQQVKSAVRRSQVQTFRKDVRQSASGLILEKHRQCRAFA